MSVALRRQPVVFWCLAGLATLCTFVILQSALETTTEGADAYGDLVETVVARHDLDVGHIVTGTDTEVALLPRAMVPAGTVSGDPTGRTVRHPIVAGEAVAATRLGPDGAVGIAALLQPGERAVAISLPPHQAPIEVGQRVDVLATVDPSQAMGRPPTSVVAEHAVVVAVDEAGITVAAPSADASRIATALSYAVISVAISG